MRKCIICNLDKEDNSFNEEHVIPLILGNKTFTIQNVCTCCNSLMGEKIIAPFSTSDFIVAFRKRHDLRGHSRKVPAYKHLVTYKDGIKAVRNQRGEIEIGPQVLENINGFSIIGSNFQKMKEIADNKAKKAGKKWAYKIEERVLEGFSFPTGIDYRFILAVIVVCYETMFYLFGYDYLSDSTAQELRSAIYEYIYHGNKKSAVQIGEIDPLMADAIFTEFHGDKNSVMVNLMFDEENAGATFIIDGVSLLNLKVGNNIDFRFGEGNLILIIEDGHLVRFDLDYTNPKVE